MKFGICRREEGKSVVIQKNPSKLLHFQKNAVILLHRYGG